MIKKIVFNIARKLLSWAIGYVYDYVDQDDDGKISKEEFEKVYKDFQNLMRKLRRN